VGGVVRAPAATTILAALVFVTAGCSAVAERATESALGRASDGQADFDLDEGSISVEGQDGERFSVGGTSDVPEEIAAVVPVPQGFQPATSMDTTEDGRRATSVSGVISTDDPVGLADELEGQLTSEGWERASHTNQNDQLVALNLTRGDEALTISLVADDQEAMLNIIYLRPG
jgi:hypothetical protein